jgi:hypothetical protein
MREAPRRLRKKSPLSGDSNDRFDDATFPLM